MTNRFVYVVKAEGGYYKIGITAKRSDRLSGIMRLPWATAILTTIQSNDPEWLERYLHSKFAARRICGEWFKLNASDIRFLKSHRRLNRIKPKWSTMRLAEFNLAAHRLIKERGLTYVEVLFKVGVQHVVIKKAATGERSMSQPKAEALAKYLRIRIAD